MSVTLDFSNQISVLFSTVDRRNVKLLSWGQREQCRLALQKTDGAEPCNLDKKSFLEIKAVLEMKRSEPREPQHVVIQTALCIYCLICSGFKGLFNMVGLRISSQELMDLAKAYRQTVSSHSGVVGKISETEEPIKQNIPNSTYSNDDDTTETSIRTEESENDGDMGDLLDQLKNFINETDNSISEESLKELHPIHSEKLDGDKIGISHSIGRRPAMEDSSIYKKLDLYDVELFGVFDGHTDTHKKNEHQASVFVKDHVEGILLNSLKQHNPTVLTEEGITLAFKECCKNLDEEYLKRNNDDGTTLLLVLRQPNKLSIANLGDSRAIVIVEEHGSFKEECLTEDAKPDVERFKLEIERKGGKVYGNKIGGMLSVAASIGDHNCKVAPDKEKLTTCVPEVSFYPLEPGKNYYLLLACDGLFEYRCRDPLETIEKNIKEPADIISRILVNGAINDGSGDNITALFAKL